ncbi:hypothetical protein HWI79_3279, partial [Cryptosporidium felis]
GKEPAEGDGGGGGGDGVCGGGCTGNGDAGRGGTRDSASPGSAGILSAGGVWGDDACGAGTAYLRMGVAGGRRYEAFARGIGVKGPSRGGPVHFVFYPFDFGHDCVQVVAHCVNAGGAFGSLGRVCLALKVARVVGLHSTHPAKRTTCLLSKSNRIGVGEKLLKKVPGREFLGAAVEDRKLVKRACLVFGDALDDVEGPDGLRKSNSCPRKQLSLLPRDIGKAGEHSALVVNGADAKSVHSSQIVTRKVKAPVQILLSVVPRRQGKQNAVFLRGPPHDLPEYSRSRPVFLYCPGIELERQDDVSRLGGDRRVNGRSHLAQRSSFSRAVPDLISNALNIRFSGKHHRTGHSLGKSVAVAARHISHRGVLPLVRVDVAEELGVNVELPFAFRESAGVGGTSRALRSLASGTCLEHPPPGGGGSGSGVVGSGDAEGASASGGRVDAPVDKVFRVKRRDVAWIVEYASIHADEGGASHCAPVTLGIVISELAVRKPRELSQGRIKVISARSGGRKVAHEASSNLWDVLVVPISSKRRLLQADFILLRNSFSHPLGRGGGTAIRDLQFRSRLSSQATCLECSRRRVWGRREGGTQTRRQGLGALPSPVIHGPKDAGGQSRSRLRVRLGLAGGSRGEIDGALLWPLKSPPLKLLDGFCSFFATGLPKGGGSLEEESLMPLKTTVAMFIARSLSRLMSSLDMSTGTIGEVWFLKP